MPRSSKIFRLFVSSTFTDLKHERTALQRYVFPRLKELCEQYGTKFQAIDLRWGVPTEAQLDHRTMDICINELRRCKELSPKPNFLILLGNRYGWRPIPNKIEKHEFEMILEWLKNHDVSGYTLLQEWYQEDCNQLPSAYRLLPRTGKFEEAEVWEEIEGRLRSIFDETVQQLPFSTEQKDHYLLSATEHEIREGAFKQEDAADHVFAFFREFIHPPQTSHARDFIDYTEKGSVDEVNQERLARLKQDIEGFLPKENIRSHRVDWAGDDIDVSYLPDFYQDVLAKLEGVIRRECEEILELPVAMKEKEIHEQFSKAHSQFFIGREEQLMQVEQKLKQPLNPVIISGESGVGKTAFAAALANHLKENGSMVHLVQRYIGASSFGLNSFELLQSILIELQPERAVEIFEMRTMDELEDELLSIFKNASLREPIVIVMDGLDQLQDRRILSSLFVKELPKYVTIIGTVAKDSSFYTSMTRTFSDNHFIEIVPMSRPEGRELLGYWLNQEQRTLQPEQEELVLQSFEKSPLPLYLKLAFEEVKLWTSFQEKRPLLPSIDGILEQFFERLSHPSNHGSVLINHVFGLLAASRNGLEEAELLALLSENSDVMEDFYSKAKHEYLGKNLPVVIWARLFNDLEPYLMERNENGSYIYSFYHRQIGRKIKETYLKQDFHEKIADYFQDKQNFLDGEESQIPNHRKAFELPLQLYQSGYDRQMESLLTDFNFLQSKIQTKLSHDLLRDYENLKNLQEGSRHSTQYADDFSRFCQIHHSLLVQFPEQILPFAIRMPEGSKVFREAKRWYEEKSIQYLLSNQGQDLDLDYYQHTFQLPDIDLSFCKWHPNGRQLLTIHDDVIKIWDIYTGEEINQHYPGIGTIKHVVFSEEEDLLALASNHKLSILESSTFTCVYETQVEETILNLAWRPNGEDLAVGTEKGIVEIIHLPSQEKVTCKPIDQAVLQLAWRRDGDELAIWYQAKFSSDYRKMVIWDVHNQTEKKVLRSKYQLMPDTSLYHYMYYDDEGFLWTSESTGIMVWNIERGVREDSTIGLEIGRHYFYQTKILSVLDKGEIFVWEGKSGHGKLRLALPASETLLTIDFKDGLLATITVDGKVTIWDFRQLDAKSSNGDQVDWAYTHPLWVFAHYADWLNRLAGAFDVLIPRRKALSKQVEDIFAAKQVNTQFIDSLIISSSLSSSKSYLATGHLGQYMQIHNLKEDSIIQYQPFKSGNIRFCHLSADEKLAAFGTKDQVWIMNIRSGYVKKTFTSSSEIITARWSTNGQVICIVHADGLIDLIDLNTNDGKSWMLDAGPESEGQILMKWSPDGQYLSICIGNQFFVYQIAGTKKGKINEKLIAKGSLNQLVENHEWSHDSKQIAFLGMRFEFIVVQVQLKQVVHQLDCFPTGVSHALADYLHDIMLLPHEKIASLEDMAKQESEKANLQRIQRFGQVLGANSLLAWDETGNYLAVGLGNWLKVFMLTEGKETALFYTNEPMIGLYWNGDKLQTIEGNTMKRKEYHFPQKKEGAS
ncbi:AAA family ATPase [Neobacillus vireti]|uniref:WD40 domain-containing protein n=1 Tax=Neobacillus vireti TaxID=220686 RepID=UPI002FFE682D